MVKSGLAPCSRRSFTVSGDCISTAMRNVDSLLSGSEYVQSAPCSMSFLAAGRQFNFNATIRGG